MAYRSQQPHAQPPVPQHQQLSWTPQTVEQLLYTEFIKGEDVSGKMPHPVANAPPPVGLADSLRALNRYVNAPAGKAAAPSTPSSRVGGPATPRSPIATRRPNATGPRTPTANKSRPLPNAGAPNDENSPTHSSAAAARQRTDAALPAAKKGPRSERRVPWPSHVPADAQLQGKSRSQLQPITVKRMAAQEHVDPDLIFKQPTEDFPIAKIFADFPEAQKLARALRDVSGDWRTDTFSEAEEMAYKESMGFTPGAPAQARNILDAVEGRIPPPRRDF